MRIDRIALIFLVATAGCGDATGPFAPYEITLESAVLETGIDGRYKFCRVQVNATAQGGAANAVGAITWVREEIWGEDALSETYVPVADAVGDIWDGDEFPTGTSKTIVLRTSSGSFGGQSELSRWPFSFQYRMKYLDPDGREKTAVTGVECE